MSGHVTYYNASCRILTAKLLTNTYIGILNFEMPFFQHFDADTMNLFLNQRSSYFLSGPLEIRTFGDSIYKNSKQLLVGLIFLISLDNYHTLNVYCK